MIQLALSAREVKLMCEHLASMLECDMPFRSPKTYSEVAAAWRKHRASYVEFNQRLNPGTPRRQFESNLRANDRDAALLSRLARLIEA